MPAILLILNTDAYLIAEQQRAIFEFMIHFRVFLDLPQI